jgi:hypothetical protein
MALVPSSSSETVNAEYYEKLIGQFMYLLKARNEAAGFQWHISHDRLNCRRILGMFLAKQTIETAAYVF